MYDDVQLSIKDAIISKLKSVSNIYESTNTSTKPKSSYIDDARKLISISDKIRPCNLIVEIHKNQLHINSTHCGVD